MAAFCGTSSATLTVCAPVSTVSTLEPIEFGSPAKTIWVPLTMLLPDTVTCYLDSTVALPLITLYALATRTPRPPRRLMDRLDELTRQLEEEYSARRREMENEK